MVAPLVAAAAISGVAALGSGIAQWMSSNEANKANAAERKRIAALFDKIQTPGFDVNDISPDEYAVVQKFIPEQARYIAEANPEIVKASKEGELARGAQMSALDRLRARGEGRDPLMDAAIGQANRENAIASNAQTQSLLQQYARRGALNSGTQLAAQLGAQAQSFDRGGQMGLSAALARDQSSLDALRQAGSLGSDIYNQDISLAGKNTDIINAFNQRNANYGRDYEAQRVGDMNKAGMYNVETAQDIANKNTAGRNDARVNNRNYRNQMSQQSYTNEIDRARGAAGLSAANQAATTQAAQDRNALIQGVGNVATNAAMYYGNQSDKQDERKWKEGMAQKYGAGSY